MGSSTRGRGSNQYQTKPRPLEATRVASADVAAAATDLELVAWGMHPENVGWVDPDPEPLAFRQIVAITDRPVSDADMQTIAQGLGYSLKANVGADDQVDIRRLTPHVVLCDYNSVTRRRYSVALTEVFTQAVEFINGGSPVRRDGTRLFAGTAAPVGLTFKVRP